ncbi:MAG: Fic family protein [Lachnospiraceae bacterium]|nr:Fic family protein [Lachnospiraceae bacterium]
MAYLSVKDTAVKWGISERSVRNYCQKGRIAGAFLIGKTWSIPDDAVKPSRKVVTTNIPRTLKAVLRDEKSHNVTGGIYHKIQIELTYNSNHIEGSKLTHDETRYIYETNTIGLKNKQFNVDDIIETVNHFRCIDYIIENSDKVITEKMLKELHLILKTGTSDSRQSWFAVGDYKKLPNEVGGLETTSPEDVHDKIKELLGVYKEQSAPSLDTLLDFHVQFERIHPFQDGNGRIGRLLLFKECLKHDIVPFIITDEVKMFYYRGLSEWNTEKGYLRDTCLTTQDTMKKYLHYFKIK